MGKFICKLKDDLGFCKVFDRDIELEKIIEDNQTFFNLDVEIGNAIDFKENPEHKLDEGNFFVVDYSECDDEIQDTIQSYFDSVDTSGEIETLGENNLNKIDFLFYGQEIDDKLKLNIQSVTPSFFIKSKSFLKFNSHILYHHEENVLEFKDDFNLHIDEKNKKIYFKHFSDLKKLHKSFIEFYKEATQEEKEEFINEVNDYDLFNIDDTKLKLQPTNLKKLKHILDNKILEVVFDKPKKVERYIKKYKSNLSLKKKDDKYLVQTNKEFTDLLKVINENFYQGEITGKKLESNSTKVLESKK